MEKIGDFWVCEETYGATTGHESTSDWLCVNAQGEVVRKDPRFRGVVEGHGKYLLHEGYCTCQDRKAALKARNKRAKELRADGWCVLVKSLVEDRTTPPQSLAYELTATK